MIVTGLQYSVKAIWNMLSVGHGRLRIDTIIIIGWIKVTDTSPFASAAPLTSLKLVTQQNLPPSGYLSGSISRAIFSTKKLCVTLMSQTKLPAGCVSFTSLLIAS